MTLILVAAMVFGVLVSEALALVASDSSSAKMVHLLKAATRPKIDGVIADGEWHGAAIIELGFQVQPGDNTTPTERTEVFLAYDRQHLYVAVRAFDSNPQAVRARVSRREDIFNDDYVSLYLDTYNDRRRAYVFYFNPLGIQADGIYTEGATVGRNWDANVDLKWDGLLESKGTITADGYIIEVALPFKTMRFQAGKGRHWGLHVQRWIARKAEYISWQPISRDVTAFLIQMGSLAGLEDIDIGRTLDIVPTVTTLITGERQANGRLNNVNRLDPGLTTTWSITPNLTFTVTINPDFSQIEADIPQIEVNQRFPLFFPEKRPFFLEGDQFFRSPGALTLVNTRQIVDPDWGVKLTGKIGRNTLAFMSAADRAPGLRLPPTHPNFGQDAHFNIVRYQRDILKNSVIGVFVTDHRFAGSFNSVTATDGQIRFRQVNTIGFQLARAETKTEDGLPKDGAATYGWYEHQGRHWRIFVNDLRIGTDYRSLPGFVRRTGIQANSATIGYEFQPTRPSWYVKIRPYVYMRYLRTAAGLTDESFVDPGADITLPRDIKLYVYHSFRKESFGGREFGHQFEVIDYSIGTFKKIVIDGQLAIGEGVNFDPRNTVVGKGIDSRLQLTIKPNDRLNVQLLHIKSNLKDKRTGARLFNQDIIRNRTVFQFTRHNAVRMILEYDTRARRTDVSLLYSYTPRPNTAVYLGYDDRLFNGLDPLQGRRSEGLFRLRRTLFLKLSYNFRF